MKRMIALAAGALVAISLVSAASAQLPLTVTIPQGPAGTVTVMSGTTACGTTTVSATSPTVYTVPATCATAGGALTFTSNSQTIGTLTVPAGGTGSLSLANLNGGVTVAVPSGTGTLNAYVNGVLCGSVTLGSTAGTLTLPATCSVPGGTLTFRTATGGQVGTSLTVPASGTGALVLSNLNSPLTVTLPAGSGNLNILVNGQVCATATLSGTTSSFTLPAACDIANGTLTFQIPGGNQISTTITIPASGSGTVTLPNLTPATQTITLPAGPAGTVTIMCGTTVGGTAVISPSSSTTINLSAACSIPGQTLTVVGPANINVAGTLTVPATVTTTPLVVGSLNSANPLTIVLPAGTGSVNIMQGGNICATATLSSTGTTTVLLPVTCQVPNQTVSFLVNGSASSISTMVPATGAGTLTITTLNQQLVPVTPAPGGAAFPAPAKTGNAGLSSGGASPWVIAALGMFAVAALGARAVTRRS